MTKINIDNKEIILLYSLVFVTVGVVYFMPFFINQLFFLLILALYWKSKNIKFWFAFIIIILLAPGGLFGGSELEKFKTIPYFNLAPGISIAFFDLFVLITFFKAYSKRITVRFYFKKEILAIIILMLFTIVFSLIKGTEFKIIISLIRYWMPFTFIYSIPRLFRTQQDFNKILLFITPTAFIILTFQLTLSLLDVNILSLLTGNAGYNLLFGTFSIESNTLRATNFYSENILLNVIFASVMLSSSNDKRFKKYLLLVLIVSILSTIIAGTRLWIIALIFALSYYMLFIAKRKFSVFLKGLTLVTFIFMIATSFPQSRNLLESFINRYATIIEIANSGAEVESSADFRFNVRLPLVLEKFQESPILGQGFTQEFSTMGDLVDGKYRVSATGDYHVGNFNLLANVGVVGFLIFLYFWLSILIKFNKNKKFASHQFKESISILKLFFLIFLIAHFTTYQFFGLTQTTIQNFFMVIYLFFVSNIFDQGKYNYLTTSTNYSERT